MMAATVAGRLLRQLLLSWLDVVRAHWLLAWMDVVSWVLSTLAPVDWYKVSSLGLQQADLNDGDGLLDLLFIASYVG